MVFRERQTILAPIGLVTQPNNYGVYPGGALKRAENVTLRNVGELVQMPSTQGPVSIASAGAQISKLVGLDAGHVLAIAGTGSTARPYADGTAYTFQGQVLSNPITAFPANGARACSARLRERLTLNAPDCCVVTDSMAPTVAADRVFRRSGMPQPQVYLVGQTTVAGVMPPGPAGSPNAAVGYRLCVRREFADGYFIRSVPSPLFVFTADGGPTKISFVIYVYTRTVDTGLQVGDVLEMYRTDAVTFVGTDPRPSPSVGETLKLVNSHALTLADTTAPAAAPYYIFTDRQEFVPGTLITPGQELYTNPYQETEVYANRQPPAAQVLATFKGHQFFGNTTDRAVLKFTCAGGFGYEVRAIDLGIASATFKANGIGTRTITGTNAGGSNQITGVSAADMVGIKVGQVLRGADPAYQVPATIIAVGASTITLNKNATLGSGLLTHDFIDVVVINGFIYPFETVHDFYVALGGGLPASGGPGGFEIAVDAPIDYHRIGSLIRGAYSVGVTFRIESTMVGEPIEISGGGSSHTMTVTATNGANYTPKLAEYNTTPATTVTPNTIKNHLVWSKEQQPEHVPTALEAFIGNGEIIAANATRDALWLWCTDGLYRLSGFGGADGLQWGIDLVSTTLILAAPQASSVLGEIVYGYANQGFVGVDSAGNVELLTDQTIGDLLPGAQYADTRTIICEANETDDEVLLGLGENGNTFSDVIWLYHAKQKGWTNIKAAAGVTSLRNITALAMLRSTASGQPRILFAVSPLGGGNPSYSGWNGPTYLQCAAEYQPVYGDDPLSLKQYIWVDFIFASGGDGKTLVPLYNSIATGQITISDLQNSGYARSGVPRRFAVAHSLSVGFEQLVVGVEELALVGQARFQGISIAHNVRTSQSKKR